MDGRNEIVSASGVPGNRHATSVPSAFPRRPDPVAHPSRPTGRQPNSGEERHAKPGARADRPADIHGTPPRDVERGGAVGPTVLDGADGPEPAGRPAPGAPPGPPPAGRPGPRPGRGLAAVRNERADSSRL